MKPIDVHGTWVLAVGTVLWAVALIGTLIFRESLAEAGYDWWVWTCLTGVVFGVVGVTYFARRERRAGRTR